MLGGIRYGILAGAILAIASAGTACQSSAIEPLPLTVHVDLSRTTASPGDTVLAITTAQGGTLLGITIDFGDGSGESFGTAGARTAKVTFKHAYKTSGTYTVNVTATDGVAGDKSAAVQLRVN